jgi:predicted phage terminase large subunit-like protein
MNKPTNKLDALQKELAQQIEAVKAAKRMEQAERARTELLTFIKHTRPDPQHDEDPYATTYEVTKLAEVLSDALEKVARGEILYLLVSAPPQHGKTEVLTRRFLPWYTGKFPHRHVMFGTYSQDLANVVGDEVRTIVNSPEYGQVFPEHHLRAGSKSKEYMVTDKGGKLSLIGRGGAGTGKPADLWCLDDVIKDDVEAQSSTIREAVWQWFTKVVFTRCHALSSVIIVMCMTGDTPVLMKDGTEKPLRDIRPGDRVATFKNGKLASSVVKNWQSSGHDNVYKIRTSSGRIVRANERHPFLIFENGEAKWKQTKDLRQGQEIFRVNGESGKTKHVWQKGVTNLLSAVGTAHRTTTKKDGLTVLERLVKIANQGETIALKIAMELHKKIMTACLQNKAVSALYAGSHQETMFERIGAESFASIIATTQIKSERCSATTAILLSGMQKLRKLLKLPPTTSDFTLDKIVEITADGIEEVFDVQIDGTENFIANGLVSHNTRWHEDDLIGRLTDKSNPHYKESIAKKFTYINIPAIIDTAPMAKALKCKVGDSLWPERFPVTHLETARDLNPLGFNAMYMGRPTPPEGAFFKRDQFMGYQPNQLPKNLRHYLSGDLAISPERDRDKSCIGHWGLDTDDTLWLLPDLYWEQKAADDVVEDIVQYGKDFPIFTFFGEKGQIQKSIGPFLEKRMREEGVHFNIELFPTTGNKGARAVSFRGRMAQGKVRFPTFAPWWPKFFEVMLKFTGSGEDREDDPADMCGLIGQGLGMQVRASGQVKQGNVIRPGTLAWVKQASKAERDIEERKKRLRGM